MSSSRQASACDRIEPAFILLFSVRLKGAFKGFTGLHPGVVPIPADDARAYLEGLATFERQLLGKAFLETRRITRWPLGRIALQGTADDAPTHADVYLLAHKSGVALWEVWLPAPEQAFDAARLIAWLDPESEDGLVARLWHVLGEVNQVIAGNHTWSGLYLPLTLIRLGQQAVADFTNAHGPDLVRLLFLDRSHRPLKPAVVSAELARDYCARQGGMMLLARRGAIDVRDAEEERAEDASPVGMPPKSVLPFLITLELLLLEHAVLQHLYDRLSRHMPQSVDELLLLRQEVTDSLEEYYGAIAQATRFSAAVTADGERLLGVEDIYDAVMDRLDTVSFAITTRAQRQMTLLQFWLTIVFGASEIGFIAASIATWYYRSGLGTVLGWTVGAALVTGIALALMLKGKLE